MTPTPGAGGATDGALRARRRPRWMRPTWGGMIGLFLIALAVFAAVSAPWLAPFDPLEQNLPGRLKPPMWVNAEGSRHILGTDPLGRDLLSRVIHGARVSLVVAAVAVPISVVLGVLLGVTAGMTRGLYEATIMRLIDVQLALPFILVALAVLVAIGPTFINIVLLLGITGWMNYARILRAETLSIRERDFVSAARAIGASRMRITARHVLPNLASTIIVLITLQIPQVIILESALSFLGLGIQPPTPSWGSMLSTGRQYMLMQWWVSLFPGLAIALVALGGNLLGDWLRDALDPRHER
jgi:peptide/nickel transport system permease protein